MKSSHLQWCTNHQPPFSTQLQDICHHCCLPSSLSVQLHLPVVYASYIHPPISTQDFQLAASMYVLPLPHCHELFDDEGDARVPHVLPGHTGHPGVGQDVGVPQPYVTLRKWPVLLAAACACRNKHSQMMHTACALACQVRSDRDHRPHWANQYEAIRAAQQWWALVAKWPCLPSAVAHNQSGSAWVLELQVGQCLCLYRTCNCS